MQKINIRYLLILMLFPLAAISQVGSAGNGSGSDQVPPGYSSYEEIIALADSLSEHFPSICRKTVFAASLGGRQLAALKISDNADTDETEPAILFDGGCHGDEVGGSENLIRFARDLCLGYGSDSIITALVNNREIWLFLMVNPDGRVNMSRFNGAMVDINRDYGYMWDASGGSSDAFSQPETKALRSCMLREPFSVYISFHSGMQQAAYPWAYRGEEPSDKPNLRRLAKTYSDSSGYPSLLYGQSYSIMYQTNGMSVDFAYGALGIACFTLEISVDQQPPDPTVFYQYNYPAMLEMIRRSGWGVAGQITDSVTGEPVAATLWVDGFFPSFTHSGTGDFHKYLVAGQHTLTVTANGYKTRKALLFNVPQQGSATMDVSLVPDTGWYAHQVAACRIPGDNPGDEGNTSGALGEPDHTGYSLGNGGWIVLDLGDTIFDLPGNELGVFETGISGEGFLCQAGTGMDGPWIPLGVGTGTSFFDLSPSDSIRYIRIIDDGDGPVNGPDAGFDLDAIKVLNQGVLLSLPGPSHPAENTVRIYPNPGSGLFTAETAERAGMGLTVYDVTGRRVRHVILSFGANTLDLSELPDGVYTYRAETSGPGNRGLLIKIK